jgi:hypothetical protein
MKQLSENITINDNVVTTYRDNYGNTKNELDTSAVQGAISAMNLRMQDMVAHINFVHRKMDDLRDVQNFMQWIEQVHPELKRDYVVSRRVASRIEGPDDGAVCVEAG